MRLLDIALFATADAALDDKLDFYLRGANYHLASYDIRLNVYPKRPNNPIVLPALGPVHDRPPDFGFAILPGDLRAAAAIALPEPHGIPVIFCRFQRSDAGLTVYHEDLGANRNIGWLNYILVNSNVRNFHPNVILHELIHAANYVGDDAHGTILFDRIQHDHDPTSIMVATASPASVIIMYEMHAAYLRRAYFSRDE